VGYASCRHRSARHGRALPTPRARSDYTEDEALTRIVEMFEAEIARPNRRGQHHASVANKVTDNANQYFRLLSLVPERKRDPWTVEPYHFEFMAEAIREAEISIAEGRDCRSARY